MYRYGVIYIIIGEVVLSFIGLAINTYYTKQLIGYGLIRQLQDINKIVTGAIIAAVLSYSLTLLIGNNLWMLVVGTLSSFIIYAVTQYIINRQFLRGVISLKKIIRTV